MIGSVGVSNNCLACDQKGYDIRTGIKQVTWYGGLLSVISPGFPFTTIAAYAINQNAGLIERNVFRRECSHQISTQNQERCSLNNKNEVSIGNVENTAANQSQTNQIVLSNHDEPDKNLSAGSFKFAKDENSTSIFT